MGDLGCPPFNQKKTARCFHRAAKVQGGDTPEGVPHGSAKGGTRNRTEQDIGGLDRGFKATITNATS